MQFPYMLVLGRALLTLYNLRRSIVLDYPEPFNTLQKLVDEAFHSTKLPHIYFI